MKLATANQKDGQWHAWFAWLPVLMTDGSWAWLEAVSRRWEKNGYLSIIDPYDPGEYRGAWEYRHLDAV